jgi:uncharacterized cupin superfamily protein
MTMEKYLITNQEIAAFEGAHKTHYLNPHAKRIKKSLGDLCGITGFGFHIIEIAPGYESTEYHVHYYEDECVYILEGQAELTIGDSRYAAGPGDFIGYRAGGLPHTMQNVGTTTLKCIVVGQRLEHDVADYPRQHKRLFRNKGRGWDLVDITDIDNPHPADYDPQDK